MIFQQLIKEVRIAKRPSKHIKHDPSTSRKEPYYAASLADAKIKKITKIIKKMKIYNFKHVFLKATPFDLMSVITQKSFDRI